MALTFNPPKFEGVLQTHILPLNPLLCNELMVGKQVFVKYLKLSKNGKLGKLLTVWFCSHFVNYKIMVVSGIHVMDGWNERGH